MSDVWSYLFNVEPGAADTLVYVLGVAFLVAFAVGLVVYLRRRVLFRASPPLVRLAGNAGLTAAIIGGMGLLFTLAAALAIPVFAARFWLVGLALVGLGLLAWFVYDLVVRLPRQVERYQQESLRARYLPKPGGKRKVRGKKR